jgi:hypothetical protein
MLGHELTIKQAEDFLFGDAFRESHVEFFQGLAFGEPGRGDAALQSPLAAGGDFGGHQGG